MNKCTYFIRRTRTDLIRVDFETAQPNGWLEALNMARKQSDSAWTVEKEEYENTFSETRYPEEPVHAES